MELFESLVPVAVIILCLAGSWALVALAYLLTTLVKAVKETMLKVDPLIDDARNLTATAKTMVEQVKPAVEKVEPIMDRATLTMDAVNLEIMRADQIMEDINSVTTQLSKAADSLDAVASAPLDLLSKFTGKLRDRLAPFTSQGETKDSVVDAIDSSLSALDERMIDLKEQADKRHSDHAEKLQTRIDAFEKANETSAHLKQAAHIQAKETTDTILGEGNGDECAK